MDSIEGPDPRRLRVGTWFLTRQLPKQGNGAALGVGAGTRLNKGRENLDGLGVPMVIEKGRQIEVVGGSVSREYYVILLKPVAGRLKAINLEKRLEI